GPSLAYKPETGRTEMVRGMHASGSVEEREATTRASNRRHARESTRRLGRGEPRGPQSDTRTTRPSRNVGGFRQMGRAPTTEARRATLRAGAGRSCGTRVPVHIVQARRTTSANRDEFGTA